VSRDARVELKPLTSLRFFAAMLVLLVHLPQTQYVSMALSLGNDGVGFFFLLSGFILTYTYRHDFDGPWRMEALRRFYVARIARVYPVHLAAMAFTLAVLLYVGEPVWDTSTPIVRGIAFLAQLLLLQSWFPIREIYMGGNLPSWSISDEAFFYTLFPFIACGIFRFVRGRALLTAVAIWGALVLFLAPQHVGLFAWLPNFFPPIRLVDFVVGMLLGVAFLDGTRGPASILRQTTLEVLALIAVSLAILASLVMPTSLRFAAWMMPFWGLAILVFARSAGAISHVLSHPALVRLGEVSFAFYLVHLSVIHLISRTIGWRDPNVAVLMIAVSFALAFALHHGVEIPMRRWIRSAAEARPRRTTTEVANA
jgi:peptidoglycan/LPS O-acetylase OafA/YrhL